ncbi:MAG: hypothetical protein ACT6QO_17065, partial [Brevundimonas aurantiaca]
GFGQIAYLLVLFFVLYLLISKVFAPRIRRVMDERADTISAAVTTARQVQAEAAAQASGRAMRAGRLLEARALAGLAATYRKLEARGETAHGAMTVENAPLQLVYDILMNPLAASDRLAIRPGAADTHLALKEAYWTQQQTLGEKNQEFRHAQLHRRAALDRRVAALEDQLKAAGLEPVAETESAR